MENQVQCPNGKSFDVKVIDRKYKFVYAAFFIAIGFVGMLGFDKGILILAAIFGFGCVCVGITYLILGLIHKADKATCKSCKMKFTV